MSLATFKKKTINSSPSATKISGKPPGGIWLNQGPFGRSNKLQLAVGNEGFSLNGGHRNVGYVGKGYAMSKNGTPFHGQYAYGGGTGGIREQYYQQEPVYNTPYVKILIQGTQAEFIKQSVLSTKGMLEKKYRWVYNGQYPNYWVQPNYSGNQTDSASQGLYVQNLAAKNSCHVDINRGAKFIGNIKNCGATLCQTSTAQFKYNDMARNAPYTKFTNNPLDSSTYTLQIQRRCQNPQGAQKPFPFAVNTGTGILQGGVSVNPGNSCNSGPVYLSPPEWYIKENPVSKKRFSLHSF